MPLGLRMLAHDSVGRTQSDHWKSILAPLTLGGRRHQTPEALGVVAGIPPPSRPPSGRPAPPRAPPANLQ